MKIQDLKKDKKYFYVNRNFHITECEFLNRDSLSKLNVFITNVGEDNIEVYVYDDDLDRVFDFRQAALVHLLDKHRLEGDKIIDELINTTKAA